MNLRFKQNQDLLLIILFIVLIYDISYVTVNFVPEKNILLKKHLNSFDQLSVIFAQSTFPIKKIFIFNLHKNSKYIIQGLNFYIFFIIFTIFRWVKSTTFPYERLKKSFFLLRIDKWYLVNPRRKKKDSICMCLTLSGLCWTKKTGIYTTL